MLNTIVHVSMELKLAVHVNIYINKLIYNNNINSDFKHATLRKSELKIVVSILFSLLLF